MGSSRPSLSDGTDVDELTTEHNLKEIYENAKLEPENSPPRDGLFDSCDGKLAENL
jgi:hypothetical protein